MRTLEAVSAQYTEDLFSYSVVVVDNDATETSRSVVEKFISQQRMPIQYCVEPHQNIAMARNRAVANATGDFLAFVDDDELPVPTWLVTLFRTLSNSHADGVLGPVPPHFDEGTPKWVIESGLYERPIQQTGTILSWNQCRTGNALLKRAIISKEEQPFNPECLSGEDQDFFRRKIGEGCRFIWCHEAPAFEVIPPVRWRRGFLIRRAMFRGVFAQRNHGLQPLRVLQALVSVPTYAIILPFALALGQGVFMRCAFKLSYHAGRLCAFFGFNPIQQVYVLE